MGLGKISEARSPSQGVLGLYYLIYIYIYIYILSSLFSRLSSLSKIMKARVGDGSDGDGGDDDARTFPEHPSPTLHATRDIISREGKSLTPMKTDRERFVSLLSAKHGN